MFSTAPHLHLPFLPASSGFHGYCLPQESQENVAPPAIVASQIFSGFEYDFRAWMLPEGANALHLRRLSLPFQRPVKPGFPDRIGGTGFAILVEQPAVAPGDE